MCGGGGRGEERRGLQEGRGPKPTLPKVQLRLCFSQMLMQRCVTHGRARAVYLRPVQAVPAGDRALSLC